MVDNGERHALIATVKIFFDSQGESSNEFLMGESLRDSGIDEKTDATQNKKDDSEVCFQNALAMLPELESLYLTSKKQALIQEVDLRDAVLTQIRQHRLTIGQLGEWAKDLLKVIATAREYENIGFRRLELEFIDWLGTGPAHFSPPTGPKDRLQIIELLIQSKRQALIILEGDGKRSRSLQTDNSVEDGINRLTDDLKAVVVSDSEETPVQFRIGESTPLPTFRRGRWSWKKDARRTGQSTVSQAEQCFSEEVVTETSQATATSTTLQQDF